MGNTKVKTQRGITLIALVITIIVLLILAAVSIVTLTGENGILTKASNAKIDEAHASVAEGISLAYGEYQIEEQSKKDSEEAITFIDFLKGKGYIDGNNIVNTEKLLGKKAATGNGTEDTDIYKVEIDGKYYVLNYYDKDETVEKLKLWQSSMTGDIEVEEPLTPPANAAYVIDVGYKDGVVTPDVKAYFVENAEASGEDTLYDVIFIGQGEMAPLDEWNAEIIGVGTNYYKRLTLKIKNAEIRKGITNIAEGVFSECSKLTNVSISSTVTSIDYQAFFRCNSLESVVIPERVTIIGDGAFHSCSNLATVYYAGNETQWNAIDIGYFNDTLESAEIVYI